MLLTIAQWFSGESGMMQAGDSQIPGSWSSSKMTALYFIVGIMLFVDPLFSSILPHALTRGLFIAGSVVALLLFLRVRRFDWRSVGVGLLWLALAVIAFFSHLAFGEGRWWPVITLVVLAILMCISCSSTRWVQPVLAALVVLLSIHMIATLVMYAWPGLFDTYVKPIIVSRQSFAGDYSVIGYKSGLTTHYSINGNYMAIGLLLTGSFAIQSDSRKMKIASFVVAILFLIALILTTKRAQLGLGILSLVVAFLLSSNERKLVKLLIAVLCFAVAAFVLQALVPGIAVSFERAIDTLRTGDINTALNGRQEIYDFAIEGWCEKPFFGHGWGTFECVWQDGRHVSIYAHNEILHELYEVGLVGTAYFVVCLVLTFVMAVRVATRVDSIASRDRASSCAVLFALSYLLFATLYGCTTGMILQATYTIMPFFLAIAILISARNDMKASHDDGGCPIVS